MADTRLSEGPLHTRAIYEHFATLRPNEAVSSFYPVTVFRCGHFLITAFNTLSKVLINLL